MTTAHTPTPWAPSADDAFHDPADIMDQKGELLASTYPMGSGDDRDDIAAANVLFIIRAVNAHDALVAALTAVLPYAEDHQDAGPIHEGWKSPELEQLCKTARAALDLLKEEKPT